MPAKTWVVGEEVLAPDFNTYVQQQVIAGFSTTAARTAGLASPVRGQASYIASNDANEGPEFWDGIAWRKAWNMPWGIISTLSYGAADMAVVGGETPLHGNAVNEAITRPPGRYTKFGINLTVSAPATPGAAVYWRVYFAGIQKYLWQMTHIGASSLSVTTPPIVLPSQQPTSAPVGWTVQLASGGATTIASSSFQPTYTWVEDCGPAPAAPAAKPGEDTDEPRPRPRRKVQRS